VATRHGNRDPYAAPHGVYPCLPEGDGLAGERWLAIACTDDTQWSALVDQLGRPAWATEATLSTLAGRKAVEDLIDERLGEWTSQHRASDLFRQLQPSVAAAPVQAPGELIEDPQLQHLGYWPVLEHTVMGPVPYNGMQARLSLTPGRARKAAPCVGEDSLMVLVDLLGYDEDEVADLLACEAVEINVD
jgi:benzylsuccinate CoA-transferase BbsF subunit